MAYVTLTDATFREEVLKSKQPVLVGFLAKWSGPCHIIAPGLRETGERYKSRVKFCKLDMDSQMGMARQYGVYGVPTILLFRGGQLVDHITGVVPRTVISQKLDTLLEPDTDERNGEDYQKTP
ncbi:thioredoxin family protein [Candidatus Poribacteria bacterium]